MRDAALDLKMLARELVEGVMARGMREATVERYRSACNRLIAFAESRGESLWSDGLAASYVEWLGDRLERGLACAVHHRFQLRALRMLSSLAETGELDTSRAPGGRPRYDVSDELAATVERILEDKCRTEGERADLRGVVRHLLWYAAKRGTAPLEIDDALVMGFLVGEVPVTNAGSAGRASRAVRRAAEWLREHGAPVERDYSALTVRGRARRIIPAYTEDEVRSIVGAIDATTAAGKRGLAIVLVAYCTGLRGADILGLRLSEVDWRNQRLTTRVSKTHGRITCELNGETMNAIADYVLEARPDCDAPELFLTVYAPYRPMPHRHLNSWFDALCERAGVEKLPGRSFHSLRRAFETTMVSRGVPIETASQMVGHRDVTEDKPYITHDAASASLVAMGFGDVPLRHGSYAGGGGGEAL